jgi:iron complex transport system substrate-binding protein
VAAANGSVEIPHRPVRIVSLSPTATEILFAIGAGPQVVAVDAESSYPPEAPRTGLSGYTPNIEAIVGYRPDLVVFASEPGGLEDAMERTGVPAILQPAALGLEDTYRQIRQLGTATGRERQAADLVDGMKGEIEAIVESVPRFPQPPGYYHELDQSYFTATSKTFIGETYALLGLTNIADSADGTGSGYIQLSAEFIVHSDPAIIFLADADCCAQSAATLAARPGWGQIRAVRSGTIVPLDGDVASRWGPRTVELVSLVAAALRSFEPRLR